MMLSAGLTGTVGIEVCNVAQETARRRTDDSGVPPVWKREAIVPGNASATVLNVKRPLV